MVAFNEERSCLEVSYQNQVLPITISLSHSHGVVFLGASLHQVQLHSIQLGVDIELISDKRNHQKLAKHFFHPTEIEWVEAKGQSAFFRAWTLKEALAKASKVSGASLLAKNVFEQLRIFNSGNDSESTRGDGGSASCQYQQQSQYQSFHPSKANNNTFDMSIVFDVALKIEAIQTVFLASLE